MPYQKQKPPTNSKAISYKTKFIEETLFYSWWVILFLLLCHAAYERGLAQYHRDYDKLYEQLLDLQAEKQKALEIKEDLQLQINSQSDHAWLELVLIKGLGVVPEGQTKVFFEKAENH